MSDSSVQTVVIGGGVVGLACAASLARSGREVFVLERESAVGQGVSSRNSEVIHAGIYYTPGSLKAQLCLRGRELLYQYARQRQIPASRIGKLIVATDDEEVTKLAQLVGRARENGVDDLRMIDRATALAMQPGLNCSAALHSPSTGIIDSHALMISLIADIEQHGGAVVCRAPVNQLESTHNGELRVCVGGDEPMQLHCTEVINSAGLQSIGLANQTVGLCKTSIPRARFAKGNYFRLQGKSPFTMLIYPAPVEGGLGVHLTLDHGSQTRFGPDVEWLDEESIDQESIYQESIDQESIYQESIYQDSHCETRAEDKTLQRTSGSGANNFNAPVFNPDFNYEVDPNRAASFYSAIRRYWPDLPDGSLLPDYSGIRPKAVFDDGSEVDFQISTPAEHGTQGLVNLYGIESPGLTSSLAIAEHVTQALDSGER